MQAVFVLATATTTAAAAGDDDAAAAAAIDTAPGLMPYGRVKHSGSTAARRSYQKKKTFTLCCISLVYRGEACCGVLI